jgi:hypothetical protein
MRVASIVWILLVPAVALAAPRKPGKRPGKKPPATKPAAPEPAAPEPTVAEPDPEPAASAPPPPAGGDAPSAPPPSAASPPEQPGADPTATAPAASALDVDALRQEYLALRDELFQSRARANAVASQLYSTRVIIRFTYASGRYYSPAKAQIRLNGATVYEDARGGIAGDDGVRFDGYVAPGRHLITFRVEAIGKDDDTFTSVTETQVTVKAVAQKDLVVAAKARDAGDIAYAWSKQEKGSYGLGIDVAVKAQPRATRAGEAPAKAAPKAAPKTTQERK